MDMVHKAKKLLSKLSDEVKCLCLDTVIITDYCDVTSPIYKLKNYPKTIYL